MSDTKTTIAVLGGTGKEGGGLALRWARAGHRVIIGSRSAERAEEAAAQLRNAAGAGVSLHGDTNVNAASAADIVVLSVPFAAQRSTVEEVAPQLQAKILVDVTVPLVPPQVSRVQLPEGGSAVAAVQKLLGDGVRVVSAFQNISSHLLASMDHTIECDVLVCSDDRAAAREVIGLAEEIGLTAWDAGALCNSAAAEAMTSVLIALNKHYKVPGSGIRITGVPRSA